MPDSEDFLDPYLDPETGVLRNLIGARTKESLEDAEGSLSFARLVQLMDRPPKATGDLAELRAIHRQLFQDLYDWAGQIRIVDIRKNVGGAGFFLPSGMIERASVFAAGELQSDNALRGLDREHFIDRLAYHYDQVNYIHPFREGNGRVQRVFWNGIALAAGWQLDWRPVHGDVNDRASRAASDRRDLGPLRAMFDHIVTPAPPTRNRARVGARPNGSVCRSPNPSPSPPETPARAQAGHGRASGGTSGQRTSHGSANFSRPSTRSSSSFSAASVPGCAV